MIRCVMLDLGNVLVPMNAPRFYSGISRHSRVRIAPWELFEGRFKHFFAGFELDTVKEVEFFEKIKKAYRLQGLSLEDFLQLLCRGFFEPDLKILELKLRLKQKNILLALVTNISRYQFHYLLKAYPEFFRGFDSIAASCELGIRKPNPEIWIHSLDELGVRAEECLFVDDRLPNMKAFRNLGGLSFHYDVANPTFRINRKKLERAKADLFAMCARLGLI